MKNNYLLCLFLLLSLTSNAQKEFWKTTFPGWAPQAQRSGVIIEKEFSFISVTGNYLYENSYFLESQGGVPLPLEGAIIESGHFYAAEIETASNSFYFFGERTGSTGNMIYLKTFDGEDFIVSDFGLPVTFDANNSKGPAAVKVDDENVLIFANESFYNIKISETGELSLEWEKTADYGLIADAEKHDGGYILCNELGKLVLVDENADEIWAKDLGHVLYSVRPTSNGFILTGSINGEAALIKTDINGEIIWERVFGQGEALDLTRSPSNGFVFSGNTGGNILVVKTNSDGDEIWRREFDEGMGGVILKSQYGGYFVQSKLGQIVTVLRLDEEGNFAEEISDAPEKVIEANNIRSSVSNRGEFFTDGDNVRTTYPEGESTTVLYTGGLLLSAIDQDNERLTSATSYSLSDFGPGPQGAAFSDWDRMWKISKTYVDRLRIDIADGTIDSSIPLDIWTYPGAGNPNFNLLSDGEVVVPPNMAPFVDVNNDGIYNVLDGDYPEMKGDEMLWWVMHSLGNGSILGGNTLKLEVKGAYYAYNCNESNVLYNSTFLELDIKNTSDNNYTDLYLGTFVDLDHGCYTDDFVGSIPNLNSVISYNSDSMDGEDGICQFGSVFSDEIPVQSITYLNNDLDYSMYYGSGIVGGPELSGPSNAEELLNFLQGKWVDGTPLTEGGTGYGGTTPVNHVFTGNPDDDNEWSMCSSMLLGGDTRMIFSSGPKVLLAQEVLELDLGMLTHEAIDHPCPNTDLVEQGIIELQGFYDNGGLDIDLNLGGDIEFEPGETITLDGGIGAVSYEWSTGETTQSIEVMEAGTYSVTVTSIAGCEYTDEVTLFDITGIDEVQEKAPKIYPNPTSQSVFIELQNDLPSSITLENTLGQRIQNIKVANGSEYSILELNVGNLAQGMYLLRFQYEDTRKVLLRKLVVSK